MRRDLRLEDNIGLFHALKQNFPVLILFIFDENILSKLSDKKDARVTFIHENLGEINKQLQLHESSTLIKTGDPLKIWNDLLNEYSINEVFLNEDYEPYALKRDESIKLLLKQNNITYHCFKDQVIFHQSEIVKDDGLPYTVFTPYKNKWLNVYQNSNIEFFPSEKLLSNLFKINFVFPSLKNIGFEKSDIKVPPYNLNSTLIETYHLNRDFPYEQGTTLLGTYLRFGTVSIRKLTKIVKDKNPTLLSEFIWREFFKQILYHFPHVVEHSFKKKYDNIVWENNEQLFKLWCDGKTGYPLVDAGMRELNATGLMHNRVRMVTASFLVKHLLIDWRWGEAYFAEKLLDFDLSANNGNWQWAAGCGCDAAPYFRVFNPYEQHKKFDKNSDYVKKWVPEFQELTYCKPIVNHESARKKVIEIYKKGLATTLSHL